MNILLKYRTRRFYAKWFRIPLFQRPDKSGEFKDKYIRSLINSYAFKFIYFDDNQQDNEYKLQSLFNSQLWFSPYYRFKDRSEFSIKYYSDIIANCTGMNEVELSSRIESIKQLYDVCCITRSFSPYMWREYANKGNGFCLKFSVKSTEYFYPVDYCLFKHNFTMDIIKDLLKKTEPSTIRPSKASFLFAVQKHNDYKYEDELRLLSSDKLDTDDNFASSVYQKKKQEEKYPGMNIPYCKVGINLESIIIGSKCNDSYRKRIQEFASNNEIKLIMT